MKRLLFLIILFIPLLVHAQECQYTYPVRHDVDVFECCTKTSECVGTDSLELQNVVTINTTNPCHTRFEVYNKAPYTIRATMDYSTRITVGANTSVEDHAYKGYLFAPQKAQKFDIYNDQASECSLINESVSFTYESTLNLTCQNYKRPQIFQECVPYTAIECTSHLSYEGYCIESCPDGYFNCQNICQKTGDKQYGQEYVCEQQCSSSIGKDSRCIQCTSDSQCTKGVCNLEQNQCVPVYLTKHDCAFLGEAYVFCQEQNACILPSSKKNGEGYTCVEECSSGRGDKNVCLRSYEELFLIWSGIIIISLLLFGLTYLLYRNNHLQKMIKERENRKKDLDSTIEDITKNLTKYIEKETTEKKEKLKSELQKLTDAILDLQQQKTSSENEVISLNKRLEDTKKSHEIEIRKITKQFNDSKEKLNQEKKTFEKSKQEFEFKATALLKEQEQLQKEQEQYEIYRNAFAEYKKNYIREENGTKYILDNEGYEVYADNPHKKTHKVIGESIYNDHEDEFVELYGKEMTLENKQLRIHHIDKIRVNNKPENLAIVSWRQHPSYDEIMKYGIGKNERIVHDDITPGDRKSGLNQLKRLKIKQPHIPELRD